MHTDGRTTILTGASQGSERAKKEKNLRFYGPERKSSVLWGCVQEAASTTCLFSVASSGVWKRGGGGGPTKQASCAITWVTKPQGIK